VVGPPLLPLLLQLVLGFAPSLFFSFLFFFMFLLTFSWIIPSVFSSISLRGGATRELVCGREAREREEERREMSSARRRGGYGADPRAPRLPVSGRAAGLVGTALVPDDAEAKPDTKRTGPG
jgi:hypothetical protein